MLEESSPPPTHEVMGIPVSTDQKLINRVQRLVIDHSVISPEEMDAQVELGDDEGSVIPKDFKMVIVGGRGLAMKIVQDVPGEVTWEMHFGLKMGDERLNSKDIAAEKGITVFDTLWVMMRDFAYLKELFEKNPQISPDLIVGGATNQIMFEFLTNPKIDLVEALVPKPGAKVVDSSDATKAYISIFNGARLAELLNKVEPDVSPRANLRSILRSKK